MIRSASSWSPDRAGQLRLETQRLALPLGIDLGRAVQSPSKDAGVVVTALVDTARALSTVESYPNHRCPTHEDLVGRSNQDAAATGSDAAVST